MFVCETLNSTVCRIPNWVEDSTNWNEQFKKWADKERQFENGAEKIKYLEEISRILAKKMKALREDIKKNSGQRLELEIKWGKKKN